MLKSHRMAVIPFSPKRLDEELAILDNLDAAAEYDAFTFGSWTSHVLANGSGSASDTAFQPHDNGLHHTELGDRLPTIMGLIHDHFNVEHLQWARIFRLHKGILAPHVDFLEFEQPGVRLQLPLQTSVESLHTENDLVYHLRRGEVWRIHTTDPHSAYSSSEESRLSLCLDFAEGHFDPERDITGNITPTEDVYLHDRPVFADGELDEIIANAKPTRQNARDVFGSLAAVHYQRQSNATEVFDWFERAARATGDDELIAKAIAFRTYCIHKRAYKEDFVW
ncbi:putative nonproteinogenic amino acid hydroxylase [Stackebrandtia soli]|uniref:putative nonproteinogenic amino acid hydroxylase n=1 Tax=Stackebrandtia soli TaxID=1892856 RepID=UPI0039E7D9F5